MSRSRRKSPVAGITLAVSEAADKRRANQRLRRVAKASVRLRDDSKPMPVMKEVSNPWHMAKEGKKHFDPRTWKKRMRK